MSEWNNEQELLSLISQTLFSSVIGDVMDKIGYTRQFLPPDIRPLLPHMRVVGRAMTVLEADCVGDFSHYEQQSQPFGLMLQALDSLKKNEVYICAGSRDDYACWGELMSTRAKICEASGAIMQGYSRDTLGIEALDFPTFSYGPYGKDQAIRGRVIDYRCPLSFKNGTLVEAGDIVFGDIDGVVIIPQKIESEVIEMALKKARDENMVARKIREGMKTKDAWDKYGVM